MMNVSVGLAFLAGLASFLSPCVFALVPAYIGYLSGRSLSLTSGVPENDRWMTFAHGVAFVLGFSVIFVVIGVAVSGLGALFGSFMRQYFPMIGGVLVIIFGLHMTGILRIPFFEYDTRIQTNVDKGVNFVSSFLMGIFFAAGWSPCVGPVLGAILTLAMQGSDVGKGVMLLSSYSAGLAVPFLIAAIGVGWVTKVLSKYRKVMHYTEIVMGGIMIVIGVLLFLGKFNLLSQYGWFINLGL